MKVKMFTVWDAKGECYMQPFFAQTKGHAVRSFAAAVNQAGHDFNKWSSDFTLFEIGEYDALTGVVSTLAAKIPMGSGNEYLENNTGHIASNLESFEKRERDVKSKAKGLTDVREGKTAHS